MHVREGVRHEKGGMMQNYTRSKLGLGRTLLAALVVAALAAFPLATSAVAAQPSNTVTPVLQGVANPFAPWHRIQDLPVRPRA